MGPLVALGLRLLGGTAARGAAAGAAEGAAARGVAGAVEKESLKSAAKKLGKEFLKDKLESAGSKSGGPKFNISRNLGMMGSKFDSSGGTASGGSTGTQGASVSVNINNTTGSASNLSSLNKQMNTMINLLASIDGTLKTQLKLQSNIISSSAKNNRESNLEGKPADGLASMVAGGEAGGEASPSAGGGIMKTAMGLLKSGSIIGVLLPLLVPIAAILAGGAFAALQKKDRGGGGNYEAPEEYSRGNASVVTPNSTATSPVAKVPENLTLTPSATPFAGMSLTKDFMDKMKSTSPTNTSGELYETSKLATGGSTPTVNKPTTSISNPWVKPTTQAESLPGVSGGPKAAYQFFIGKGWSPQIAAGIVGNLQQESSQGLNPNSINYNDAGPGKHSYGLGQWNRDRYDRLKEFARSRGKPWNDFYSQLEYVQHELNTTEADTRKRLLSLQSSEHTPEEAAAIVDEFYERSKGTELSDRMRYARNLFGGKFAPPSKGRLHGMGADGTPGSSRLFGGWDGTLSSLMSKMGMGGKSGGSSTAEKIKTETPKLSRNDPGMTSGLSFKSTDRSLDLAPKIEPKVPTPTLRPPKTGSPKAPTLGRNRVSTKDVPNPSASNIIREYQLYFTARI